MARSAVPLVATGDTWSAAQHNTYIRDNESAHWPYTTTGDMAYASNATTLSRLAVGASASFLRVSSGVPTWAVSLLPVCICTHNASQSVAASTWTVMNFNTEVSDSNGMHDPVTNNSRITIPKAGVYLFQYQLDLAALTAGKTFSMHLRRNGSEDAWTRSSVYGPITYNHRAFLYSLNVNDYIELFAWHDDTVSRNVNSSGAQFSCALLTGLL